MKLMEQQTDPIEQERCRACRRGYYRFRRYCGAYVCDECSDHRGLAKCYCGWNLQPGERLEDDVDDY